MKLIYHMNDQAACGLSISIVYRIIPLFLSSVFSTDPWAVRQNNVNSMSANKLEGNETVKERRRIQKWPVDIHKTI